jgi:alkylation response protein AidB-like acyl-CoA dehydrogenase
MANNDFHEYHDELRSVAGDLLAKEREVGWAVLVAAGWVGMEVPEQLGGAGATFGESAVILNQIGRAAGTNSYLGGAVLTVGLLKSLPHSETREQLLTAVAGGDSRLSAVIGDFAIDGRRLSGSAEFVPDAVGADRLLVITDSGVAVVRSAELTVTAQPVVDETRRLAGVTADAAAVDVVLAFGDEPPTAVRALHDRAAVAIACDSLGLAEQMLSTTVDYVKVRHQFGRPIGSFQAVKHACADMLVSIEVSRQLVDDAVTVVSEGGDAGVVAAMANPMSVRPPSTSRARPCNCTAVSATRGKAASTPT